MNASHKPSGKALMWALLLICLAVMNAVPAGADEGALRWWKGNLHTHTFWSDGDDFPEMVVQWYKEHGYHFLALSDHNCLSRGQRWMAVTDNRRAAFQNYLGRFGEHWVETRKDRKDQTLVRLKPLSEYRCLFEQSDRFLLIESEEITEKAHLNVVNIVELIPPQGGATIPEILQNNVDAVLAQQKKTGRTMLVQVNHPNFQWALTAEDMMQVEGGRFFELYNAHGYVNNEGNELRASTERMWDIVLTRRLAEMQAPVMYAVATDDAHNYHAYSVRAANPGQAWVFVRARRLTPESIIDAMNAGDFYCSTGVTLAEITFQDNTLTVGVEPEAGVTYATQFIGTRRGYDRASRAVTDAEGNEIRTTRRYSREIGTVLAEATGTTARYTLKGDEIYVRARVVSSCRNESSHVPDECESAWTQPVVVKP